MPASDHLRLGPILSCRSSVCIGPAMFLLSYGSIAPLLPIRGSVCMGALLLTYGVAEIRSDAAIPGYGPSEGCNDHRLHAACIRCSLVWSFDILAWPFRCRVILDGTCALASGSVRACGGANMLWLFYCSARFGPSRPSGAYAKALLDRQFSTHSEWNTTGCGFPCLGLCTLGSFPVPASSRTLRPRFPCFLERGLWELHCLSRAAAALAFRPCCGLSCNLN